MLLRDAYRQATSADTPRLAACAALGRTLAVRRKADQVRATIATWLSRCQRPVLAVSGGKDSTLLLQLAREVEPSLPAHRADGPERLYYADQMAHRARLATAAGGSWIITSYWWDVAAMLDGREPYVAGRMRRALHEVESARGIDGVAMGLRARESGGRARNARKGLIYRARDQWICAPLAAWRAEEVVGYLLATNQLPLNPVYEKLYLQPDLNRLRDTGWMAPAVLGLDRYGYRSWLQHHYPTSLADYERACVVLHQGVP